MYCSIQEKQEIANELFTACKTGEIRKLIKLLKEKDYVSELISMTRHSEDGNKIVDNTIVEALLRGHDEIVKLLINEEVNVDILTDRGTPLYVATKLANLDMVKKLVEYCPDVCIMKGPYSPVLVACENGHLEILKYLVKNANKSMLNPEDLSLETAAIQGSHLEILQFLIVSKQVIYDDPAVDIPHLFADIKMKATELLSTAFEGSKMEIIEYLLSLGAVITKPVLRGSLDTFTVLLENKISRCQPNEYDDISDRFPRYQLVWSKFPVVYLPPNLISKLTMNLVKIDFSVHSLESLSGELFNLPFLEYMNVSKGGLKQIETENIEVTKSK